MQLTCLGRYGPYPAPLGRTTAYLLKTQKATIMLDLGAGALAHLLDFITMDELNGLVLSHLHADHCSDMRVLAFMLGPLVRNGKSKILPVYLPDEPMKDYEEIAMQDAFITTVIKSGNPVVIGDCNITFFKTIHPVPCYAMRIETPKGILVYSADSIFDPKLAAFAKGADVFLCDAAFAKENQPIGAPHMNGEEAARLAVMADVGALWLTHLHPTTNENALLAQARAVFANTWVAVEHESIEVKI